MLDRDNSHFKEQVALKYAELVYDGKWFSPLRESLDKFVNETQRNVSGKVKLKLFKGNCEVVGRKSKHSRYDFKKATYSDADTFDPSLAEGFNHLWATPFMK